MPVEPETPRRYWAYVGRAVLMAVLAVPFAVQAVLLQVILVVSLVRPGLLHSLFPGDSGLVAIGLCMAIVLAWLGMVFGRKQGLPLSAGWRYLPLLAYPLLIWLAWVAGMHVSGGDFTRMPGGIFLVLIPFALLLLATAFGGYLWILVLVPLVAYGAFLLGFGYGSRKQPMETPPAARTRFFVALAAVVLSLGSLTIWQAVQRQQKLAPAGEALREEVNMYRYRPFVPDNLLAKVKPAPALRFDLPDAPRLDGATAAYPVYAAATQALYTEAAADARVQVSKTPQAYERLIKGETDLIFVAQASPDQMRLAAERGVKLVFTPMAKEAFVFLTQSDNPVQSLTLSQIQAIYSGQISRWNEVGGADARIIAFQRPPNSGSQTVMEAKVMQGKPMVYPLEEELQEGMGGLVRQVAAYRNTAQSLGYSFRYYTTQMKGNTPVRLLAIDGVEPTPENIRSGRYPLTVDVYMVTRENPPQPVRELVDWFLGAQGQQLIGNVGYIPLH
ncbi:MAG: substrate-binding domain-containing protein [Brachymonas sp.]|nr:substrate-binding domain-containing protein [Brachymonas sp.]